MENVSEILVAARTPFGIAALIVCAGMIAFKTERVPQLLFRLLQAKLTRERFAALLGRALTFAMVAFLALCSLSFAGAWFAHADAGRVDADLVVSELDGMGDTLASVEDRTAALDAWARADAARKDGQLEEAVALLRTSIAKAETAAAQLSLAAALEEKGDLDGARAAAIAARDLADERGDAALFTRARVKEGVLSAALAKQASGPACVNVVGKPNLLHKEKCVLPSGGDAPERAVTISFGVYTVPAPIQGWEYLAVKADAGQVLRLQFRHGDASGIVDLRLHDHEGTLVESSRTYQWQGGTSLDLPVQRTGTYFLSISGEATGAAIAIWEEAGTSA